MKGCEPVPCPDFEESTLDVTASAPIGHHLVEGVYMAGHGTVRLTCSACLHFEAGNLAEALERAAEDLRYGSPMTLTPWEPYFPTLRDPDCLITAAHPEHNMLRHGGARCGGEAARGPIPWELP
jgi:hypothetical protein